MAPPPPPGGAAPLPSTKQRNSFGSGGPGPPISFGGAGPGPAQLMRARRHYRVSIEAALGRAPPFCADGFSHFHFS